MGLYRRGDNRCKNKIWWISYIKDGRQHRESSGSTNKKWKSSSLYEPHRFLKERSSFPRSKSPRLGVWVEEFLKSVSHDKTRSRYQSSTDNMLSYFGRNIRLSELTVESIFRFQQARVEQRA
jgi:hypothetical protein